MLCGGDPKLMGGERTEGGWKKNQTARQRQGESKEQTYRQRTGSKEILAVF